MSPLNRLDQLDNRANYAAAAVEPRADVTTTIFVGPTGGPSSGAGSGTTGVSITAIVGGLVAGVTLVVIAVVIWLCCARGSRSRNRARNHQQRGRRLPSNTADDKLGRAEWRAEDSFSPPQKKGGAVLPLASPTSPSSPHSRSSAPTAISVPLRASNSSGSSSSSSNEWNRASGESKYERESSDYIGPDDLGYSTTSPVSYNQQQPSIESTSRTSKPSSEEEEDNEPLPSLRAARKARRHSLKNARRDPPPPPPLAPSASNAGTLADIRRYAPAKPSPLAQTSFRNSVLSAASGASPSPSPIPPPLPAYVPSPSSAPAHDVQSPMSPSFGDAQDPFLDEHEQDHRYYREDEGGRPLSGVGYAI